MAIHDSFWPFLMIHDGSRQLIKIMIICDNDKIGDREKIVIPTQSSTNVTLPNKLRIFSHDLGYIYEKQRKNFFTYKSYIKTPT